MAHEDVFIVGAGITPLGKHLDLSVKALTERAVTAALSDAGARLDQIEAAWFANTRQGIFEGQHGIRGQCALRPLGLENIPVFNTDNACASSSAAFNLAYAYLRAGLARVALVVGAEKMNYPEKPDLMFEAFRGSWDQELGPSHLQTALDRAGAAPETADRRSVFMDFYAAIARRHMQEHGTTQRQLAAVAAKNHNNSTLNPVAHYQFPMSIDEVLADRVIAWPLTRAMCAPMTDGAAALVLCNGDALAQFDRKRAVRVRASQLTTGAASPAPGRSAVDLAIKRAYEQAGAGPSDMSFAEVHDASAFAEIQQIENLGFCARGDGGRMSERDETALGGRIPVNPSGGLLSKGHPIGATGAIQLHELVTQLRGEADKRQVAGARLGIAENGGGFYDGEEAIASATILERPAA